MIVEAFLGTLFAALLSASNRRGFRFSGDMCPSMPESIVNWSTGDWWYPVPAVAIEWEEFRSAVEISPEMLMETPYLGWQEGWEPFEDFIASEPGAGTHAWFRAVLPSGMPVYVWVGSGIEHWWTPGGEPVDGWSEEEIVESIEPVLEELSESRPVTLEDTLALLPWR